MNTISVTFSHPSRTTATGDLIIAIGRPSALSQKRKKCDRWKIPKFQVCMQVLKTVGARTHPSHTQGNWKVVRNGAIARHSTLCTIIKARYQFGELWGYSAGDEDDGHLGPFGGRCRRNSCQDLLADAVGGIRARTLGF